MVVLDTNAISELMRAVPAMAVLLWVALLRAIALRLGFTGE